MNCCDPYKELELYLKQAESEIIDVFENGEKSSPPTITPSSTPVEEFENEGELDPFLIEFNATIESDLEELLSRYQNNSVIKNVIIDHHLNGNCGKFNENYENDQNLTASNKNRLYNGESIESLVNSLVINDRVSTSNNDDGILINVATQTSPSVSPISTNLSWASECSSSVCLTTSNSDSDAIDEDDHNSSSSSSSSLSSLIGCKIGKALWKSTLPVPPPPPPPLPPPSRWWQQQVLSTKSSSAPVLKKVSNKVNKQVRSQSDRHLAEIEATEACKWLRAAGFPQYAQMYEDMQFPIEISTVVQDHPQLEPDVLYSLFRRLQILNNCAHLHQQKAGHNTDESEDEHCALSDNWIYQSDIRRWSRTCRNIPQENFDSNSSKCQYDDKSFIKNVTGADSFKDHLQTKSDSTKLRRCNKDCLHKTNENGAKLLNSLTQQLHNIRIKDITNHVSDSECTTSSVQIRRSRTKSFDISESWIDPQTVASERIIWPKPPADESLSNKTCKLDNQGPCISKLSSAQLQVLRKLALLKLTAHMEKYCPSHRTGWSWDLSKFIRKMKSPVYKDKSIFGVPISINVQRNGQPLPRNIEEALLWLQQNAINQEGLFRKSGVKSRIQTLRNLVENSNEILNYNDQQAYDVADMVKQYFRELPETLLTNKLSETFLLIFQYVPPYLRHESVLCTILLMPDEHMHVLQVLLNFLVTIAQHSSTNQMNENNLALCFAPSLFHYSQISFKQNSITTSSLTTTTATTEQKELIETRAGYECLLYFLKNYNNLFIIPKEFINQCKTSEFKELKAVKLNELGRNMGGWREYLNECQTALLKESKEKGRGWIVVSSHNPKVEISFKKVTDGHPLRFWRIMVEVEAPPSEVLHRIIRERHIWDPELQSAKILMQIEKNCEIFQYVRRNILPLPNEEYCIIRNWRTDLPKDACLIIETSIEHDDNVKNKTLNNVRGVVLASRYLIEPCGSGKSRLLYLSRIDIMGRSPEWYQKNYGHICALFMGNIANSFSQSSTTGPESKV